MSLIRRGRWVGLSQRVFFRSGRSPAAAEMVSCATSHSSSIAPGSPGFRRRVARARASSGREAEASPGRPCWTFNAAAAVRLAFPVRSNSNPSSFNFARRSSGSVPPAAHIRCFWTHRASAGSSSHSSGTSQWPRTRLNSIRARYCASHAGYRLRYRSFLLTLLRRFWLGRLSAGHFLVGLGLATAAGSRATGGRFRGASVASSADAGDSFGG
mmetsp:Transcript_34912/g.74483  ORF Transcript_34912/g.74483 Transcript_34912/m.74483 type:complete len:213 (-) Transcript_34912:371-1009(-)